MKFYYKGVEKGSIDNFGNVIFFEKELNNLKDEIFFTLVQEEVENGVIFVKGELGFELKVSRLKELGFTFES